MLYHVSVGSYCLALSSIALFTTICIPTLLLRVELLPLYLVVNITTKNILTYKYEHILHVDVCYYFSCISRQEVVGLYVKIVVYRSRFLAFPKQFALCYIHTRSA